MANGPCAILAEVENPYQTATHEDVGNVTAVAGRLGEVGDFGSGISSGSRFG